MRRMLRALLRLPGRIWRAFWQRGVPSLSYLASYLRSPRQAVEIWPGEEIPVGPRVAVFVHFDSAGAVRPYVLDYLAALRECGLSVVFVSNARKLRPEATTAVRALCDGVIVRRNIGYDFAAMREGVERLGLPRADTEMVLLLNDSVYGPLQPLRPVLERIDFAAADIWGLTESWQTRYHLQSYWVAFGRKALDSPAWQAFWRSVRPVSSKWWVILHYEIGLTQRFVRVGLRARALWPYQELFAKVPVPEAPTLMQGERTDEDGYPRLLDPVRKARLAQLRHIRGAMMGQLPLNPTSDFWRELLQSGFPFLKRELLRLNPTGVADAAEWRNVAQGSTNASLDAIELDLRRSVRDRAP